jgi:hypothetical protein
MAKAKLVRPTKVMSAKEVAAGLRKGGRAGLRAGLTPGQRAKAGTTYTRRQGGKVVTTEPKFVGGKAKAGGRGVNTRTGVAGV